jgi:hypothetical protein
LNNDDYYDVFQIPDTGTCVRRWTIRLSSQKRKVDAERSEKIFPTDNFCVGLLSQSFNMVSICFILFLSVNKGEDIVIKLRFLRSKIYSYYRAFDVTASKCALICNLIFKIFYRNVFFMRNYQCPRIGKYYRRMHHLKKINLKSLMMFVGHVLLHICNDLWH